MMDQRTDEWFQARLGKVTASRVADVMAKTKTGYSASRDNYMAQLIVERMTGKPSESFSNAAMEWGTEQEPFARAAYEAKFGALVEEVGFIQHPSIEMAGASPDGIVGNGMVEIKCPNTATMIDILLEDKISDRYVKQMQWQMACAGKEWCDFVAFDPRLSDEMRLYVARIERNQRLIDEMEEQVRVFLAEVDRKVTLLREKWQK